MDRLTNTGLIALANVLPGQSFSILFQHCDDGTTFWCVYLRDGPVSVSGFGNTPAEAADKAVAELKTRDPAKAKRDRAEQLRAELAKLEQAA